MNQTTKIIIRPSLFRHLAVIVYDLLLLLSVLLLAAAIAVGFNALVTGGQAITSGNPFFILYLLMVSLLFYGWFWTHGGQTLGMRTWKVYLISETQGSITWKQAFIRFVIAIISWLPAGMGYWWQWLGKNKLSWLDSCSGTQLHFDKQAKNKPLSRLS